MAALDFPSSPTLNQHYPVPAVPGQPVYTWDGEKWTTLGGSVGGTGASDDIPLVENGAGGAGSSTKWSRGDHFHPTNIVVSDTPPAGLPNNVLWWESDTGLLYIRYNDGDSSQWVIACPQPDTTAFVFKTGDTMSGPLTLSGAPTNSLHAATKAYVDSSGFPTNTTMLFHQTTAPPFWTKLTTYNDVGIRVVSGTVNAFVSGVAFSTVFGQTVTGGHTLTATEQASMSVSVSGPVSGSVSFLGNNVGPGGSPFMGASASNWYGCESVSLSFSGSGTASGGGASHNHPIALNLNYIDVILARRD